MKSVKKKFILLVAGVMFFIIPSLTFASSKTLIVTSFGGKYMELLKQDLDAFEKENDVKVSFIPGAGAEAHVKARNREVDVVHSDDMYSARGVIEGLYEELDEKSIPNLKNLYDIAKMSKFYVAVDIGTWVIGYNPRFVAKPTSWLDLWEPQVKGRVSMRSFRAESIQLLVLMAKLNGGDERNIDPGFKKMAELSKNISVWYSAHPEALTLMRQGDAWLIVTTDGRAYWMRDEGANIELAIPKEGAFIMASTISVVKGRPNIPLAKAFVNWRLSKGPQLLMAPLYAPTNRTVAIPPEVRKLPSHDPEVVKKLILCDWGYIVTVLDKWGERWEKEVVAK